MAFGGEVQDRVGPVLGEDPPHGGPVGDVAFHEDEARIVRHVGQVGQVAGIGQEIQHDHPVVRIFQGQTDEVRADEAGSAGDEKGFHGEREVLERAV